jgi:hypothetical protein
MLIPSLLVGDVSVRGRENGRPFAVRSSANPNEFVIIELCIALV